jgi:NRPS condensation-like uncharacterized protein
MKLDVAADLISEGMVLADHPEEPMVIRVRYILAALPDAKLYELPALLAATKKVLAANPRLLAAFSVSKERTALRLASGADLDAAAAAIWQDQGTSVESFERLRMSFDQAPLFRLRLTREDGLMLAAHHALFDGRAGMMLLAVLLGALLGGEAPNLDPPAVQEPKLPLRTRIALVLRLTWESLAQRIVAMRHPPVLLGPKETLFGTGHAFVSRETSDEMLKERLARVRAAVPECTLNDYLITALHLTIDEDLASQRAAGRVHGGDDRISVMVPVDLRKGRPGAGVLANLSASAPVVSFSKQRKDPLSLLKSVQARMADVRRMHLAHASVRSLGFLRKIGFFRLCRRVLMQHGLPRRAVNNDKTFWRYVDTVLLSNVGEPRFPPEISPYIVRIIGFAPVVPPMGLSICFGSGSRSTINFHSSDATLSEDKSKWLMDRMLSWTETLASLAQPPGLRPPSSSASP